MGDIVSFLPLAKHYAWSPREDITTHELALCMKVIMSASLGPGSVEAEYNRLPATAKRHWEVSDGVNAHYG